MIHDNDDDFDDDLLWIRGWRRVEPFEIAHRKNPPVLFGTQQVFSCIVDKEVKINFEGYKIEEMTRNLYAY